MPEGIPETELYSVSKKGWGLCCLLVGCCPHQQELGIRHSTWLCRTRMLTNHARVETLLSRMRPRPSEGCLRLWCCTRLLAQQGSVPLLFLGRLQKHAKHQALLV